MDSPEIDRLVHLHQDAWDALDQAIHACPYHPEAVKAASKAQVAAEEALKAAFAERKDIPHARWWE